MIHLGAKLAVSILVAAALAVPRDAQADPTLAETAEATDTAKTAPGIVGTITLLTGDQVTVRRNPDGSLLGDVQPADGRDHIAFLQQSGPGDLSVIPSDALPHLSSGRLDDRLFDVAYLLENGYGDKARPDIPLITTYANGQRPRARIAASDAEPVRRLDSLGGDALEVSKSESDQFWTAVGSQTTRTTHVRRIWLDAIATADLDVSVPQIGAPAAWEARATPALAYRWRCWTPDTTHSTQTCRESSPARETSPDRVRQQPTGTVMALMCHRSSPAGDPPQPGSTKGWPRTPMSWSARSWATTEPASGRG